jgi:hypothetical protein
MSRKFFVDLTTVKKRKRYTEKDTFTLAEVRKLMYQAFWTDRTRDEFWNPATGMLDNRTYRKLRKRFPEIFYRKAALRKDEIEQENRMIAKIRKARSRARV